jgi:EAL domain-containing protein (putative c-di-GMP-specific phosphodiesterase class I)/CheY-like chemotaxis protein
MTVPIPYTRKFASVMVVDDSIVQNQHATDLCRQLGLHIVGQAHNGQHALDLLDQLPKPPDLLLIDLEMPVMDGIVLIQQLAQKNQFCSILVVSSREPALLSSVKTMIKAYGLPVVDALAKPLNIQVLTAALTRYETTLLPESMAQPQVVVHIAEIAAAISGQQFIAYFQPKIRLSNGMISGVEALVRWNHPKKGMIFPNDFIALAEEHGLIHEITLQMLQMSLTWLKYWQSHGLNLSVAINLSAGALADLSLVEQIGNQVAAAGIEPKRIILEITETAVMANVALSLTTLARLRLNGFGLSIDDYGTGFSSMQQLARIPFTELKIDRSFVDGASESLQLENIVSIAIDTAKKLGLSSVAEGIETEADWHVVRRLGCDVAQGYLVAKPMPGDALIEWIINNSQRIRAL